MLGVHDEVSFLPVELCEIYFASAEPVQSGGVDLEKISVCKWVEVHQWGTNFVVAIALEDIENGFYVFEFVDSGAFRTFYAKSHSTLEVVYHCNREKVIAHKP
jgi:hypothetical protein